MPRFQFQSEFGRTLRNDGLALLAAQPTGRYADAGQWLRAFGFFAALTGTYALILMREPDIWSLGLAAIAGFLAYTVVATLCHDASHNSLSRQKWVNRSILFIGFALVGISGALWGRRHVRTHHMFPNVAGTDIDADSTALIRLTPHRPWYPWHRFQVFYAPFLYMMVLSHLAWIEDFHHLRQARAESPDQFRRLSAGLEFAASKLIHIVLALVIPALALDVSWGGLLVGYGVACASASAMFVMINIGTHVCDEAAFIKPDADGRVGHDWATHQALTAVDWSPENTLAVALTGGANAHAAHHLFPEAAHCHNARLSRLVSRRACEHGIRHNVVSFTGMLASHARHLWLLSQPVPTTQ